MHFTGVGIELVPLLPLSLLLRRREFNSQGLGAGAWAGPGPAMVRPRPGEGPGRAFRALAEWRGRRWERAGGGAASEVVEAGVEAPAGGAGRGPLRVFVFPGNPGCAAYYRDFVVGLEALLRERLGSAGARVAAVGHLGHAERDRWPGQGPFSMEEQIRHKVDFVRGALRGEEGPVALVGHSIGAYIALECMRRLETPGSGGEERVPVAKVVGQTPYLEFDPEASEQRWLDRVTRPRLAPRLLGSTAYLFRCFPGDSLARLLYLTQPGRAEGSYLSREAAGLTADLGRSPAFIENAFHMGQTEFQELRRELDWDWMAARGKEGRLHFAFAPGDHWAPMRLHNEMKARGLPSVACLEGLSHGYPTCPRQNAEMVRYTADCLAPEELQAHPRGGGGQPRTGSAAAS